MIIYPPIHHSVIPHSYIHSTNFLDAGPVLRPLGVLGRTRRQQYEGERRRGRLRTAAFRQPSQPKAPGAPPFPSLRPRPLTVRSGGSPRGGDYGPTGARKPGAQVYPPQPPGRKTSGAAGSASSAVPRPSFRASFRCFSRKREESLGGVFKEGVP